MADSLSRPFVFIKYRYSMAMICIPIKTRVLNPPQDDLFAVLDESLSGVQEGDIVAISSKVVSIGEGNCLPIDGIDKRALVESEAELLIPRPYWPSPLTVKHSAFIGTAGIDESNANGHYVLLPKAPFLSAEKVHAYLKQRFNVNNVGVIIVDSHSSPLRRGALCVSIGFWGFAPTINHVGEPDLFGREFKIEVTNLADALAASAGVVMGETDECQPVVIIRDVPKITYTEAPMKHTLFVPFEDDTFRVLYEDFLS
jgi:dihydrofolate synthase / folylpolyglutamate synthase